MQGRAARADNHAGAQYLSKIHGLNRRRFLQTAGTLAAGITGTLATPFIWTGEARAQNNKYIAGMGNDGVNQYLATNFEAIDPKWRRQMVEYFSDEPEGTVVVDTRHHYLYWIWENNTAIRYGVGVGKEGFQWFGRSRVAKKTRWPRWVPPKEMVERDPAAARSQQPGDRAQQRRLAAPRRSDDADDLARGERDVEVERRGVVAQRDAQRHRSTPTPAACAAALPPDEGQ